MAKKKRLRYPSFESIAPTGTSYSSAVEVEPGRLLHVSGQLPVNQNGEAVGGDDMEAQATQVFENLKAICDEYNVGMDRIISMNYYCADLSRFNEVRRVRERYLSSPYPVSTAVGAQILGGHLLEISMIVALD